jgi:cell division protease FtsH
VHKVSIIPRGRALGVTLQLPLADRLNMDREFALNRIAVLMGGRIAEELTFNEMTTGAGQDIEAATDLARRMVTEWGMSDKLGRLRYVDNQEEVFLGHSVSRSQTISGATAKLIDEEIRRLIEEAEARAREVLTAHMDDLHAVTKALLEYETLSGAEVRTILDGGDIDRGDESASGPTGRRSSVPSSGKASKGKDAGDAPGGLEPEPQPGG